MERTDAVAILGGTGSQGLGLALRLARAGLRVTIGSREQARAERAAAEVVRRAGGGEVAGRENADAAADAEIVVVSVPFESTAATLKAVRSRLVPGQLVVSMGVPLASAVGDAATRLLGVWQGSCAELVAALVPPGVEVVSALQNVSAHRLQQLDAPVDCDVVVCGEPGPRERGMRLCRHIPGVRAVDGGALAGSRIVEGLTALLIGMNGRYRVPAGIGIRFTGLPEADPG